MSKFEGDFQPNLVILRVRAMPFGHVSHIQFLHVDVQWILCHVSSLSNKVVLNARLASLPFSTLFYDDTTQLRQLSSPTSF